MLITIKKPSIVINLSEGNHSLLLIDVKVYDPNQPKGYRLRAGSRNGLARTFDIVEAANALKQLERKNE